MTTQALHDTGEEYAIKNSLAGVSYDLILFNDGELSGSGDNLSDSSDIGDITTEPTGSGYATQSDTFSAEDIGTNWGITNDSLVSFDTLDSSTTVDSLAIIVNFQSDDTGDGSANDHLLSTGTLTQSRDLSNFSSIDFPAGDIELTLD